MVEIEYGGKCPRCKEEFGERCIEFQSCYDCNWPYEKEETIDIDDNFCFLNGI